MESVATQLSMMISELRSEFEEEIAARVGPLDLAYCFQCGSCSGSCPTVDRMEYGPRRIMQMIRLGLAEQVLRSDDIWFCVSCYSCTARCPQGIKVVAVMTVLRNLSIARGFAKDKEATFSQIFVDIVERYGRMYEPELLIRYHMAGGNPLGILKQAGLGIRMFQKGKIGLLPERIEGIDELARMRTLLKDNGGGQS